MATASGVELSRGTSPRAAAAAVGVLRTIVLDVAAVLGAACILWVAVAVVFHLSLIMFRTGSMAPTIPAGSLALVVQMPADQARPGEVVTVDRPGLLPITHRVVSVRPGAGSAATLTLKGDANLTADPRPYTVETVRRVIWSAPGLAAVIVWWSDPVVLLATTVAVTALVVWTFWPRSRARHRSAKAIR